MLKNQVMVNKLSLSRCKETRKKTFSEVEIHMYTHTIRTRSGGKIVHEI